MLAIKSKKRFEYCSGLTVEISAPAYTENWEERRKKEESVFYFMLLSLRMLLNKFHMQFQKQRLETQIVMALKQNLTGAFLGFTGGHWQPVLTTVTAIFHFWNIFFLLFILLFTFIVLQSSIWIFTAQLAMLPTDSPTDSGLLSSSAFIQRRLNCHT